MASRKQLKFDTHTHIRTKYVEICQTEQISRRIKHYFMADSVENCIPLWFELLTTNKNIKKNTIV